MRPRPAGSTPSGLCLAVTPKVPVKILALAIFLLSLTACLAGASDFLSSTISTIPTQQQERVIAGRYLAESDLAFLEKKHTTRDEVITQLGPPTIWLEPQRIAVYGFVRFPGGRQPRERPLRRDAIFIAFDKSDRVVDWGRSDVSRKMTWLGAALAWGRSSGLELAQPARTFVEITLLPRRSAIYFYRPRDAPLGCDQAWGEVYLDKTLLGQVRCKSYLPLSLAPGTYDFRVSPNYAWNEKWARSERRPDRIQTTLYPGSVYFVETKILQAGATQPIVAVISQHSREEAMPILQALRETW